MFGLNFQSYAIGLNIGIFAVTAIVVWWAGSKISRYADTISARTGLSKAFVGLFFLALATETPEIGTTLTAAAAGNPNLVLGNLFGGVVTQTAILVAVDVMLARSAMTFFTPRPSLLLQGILLVMLLGLTLSAVIIGELLTIGGVGLWTVILFGAYLLTLYLSYQYDGREKWRAEISAGEVVESDESSFQDEEQKSYAKWPMRRLALSFLGGTGIILVAGMILAQVADALAEQTGLGTTFVGVTLLAASTSLPELSTALVAARLGNFSMAISNIFGSNALMVALLLLADLFYREGSILAASDKGATFTVAIGIVVTCAYLAGLVERRNKVIMRMGIDSVAVLLFYIGTLIVLYMLS